MWAQGYPVLLGIDLIYKNKTKVLNQYIRPTAYVWVVDGPPLEMDTKAFGDRYYSDASDLIQLVEPNKTSSARSLNLHRTMLPVTPRCKHGSTTPLNESPERTGLTPKPVHALATVLSLCFLFLTKQAPVPLLLPLQPPLLPLLLPPPLPAHL